jgi:uncharacterized damage-inducible protein DinB
MQFDRSHIDTYERGGGELAAAVRGLSREDLVWRPPADAAAELGKWSIQQIVIHMADSDAIGVHRMKRVIAEERPLLIGYDETAFANKLMYDEQSAEAAVTLFDLNRRELAKVLRRLPDEAFDRWGVHNEHGKVTLGEFVEMYAGHLANHMTFIRAKRAKLENRSRSHGSTY